jgi:hypothetical protein
MVVAILAATLGVNFEFPTRAPLKWEFPTMTVTVPASTIDAAVLRWQSSQEPAPVAAPVVQVQAASPCANGQCGVQRRGLFGRRR